jgi:hypothetical protein
VIVTGFIVTGFIVTGFIVMIDLFMKRALCTVRMRIAAM